MVSTDATVPSSSEGKIKVGEVPAGIVYAAAAKCNLFQPAFFFFFALGEYIERKRVWIFINDRFCFFKTIEADHGKERTEDLFLHDRIFRRYGIKNGRFEVKTFLIKPAACHRFFFFQIFLKTKPLFLIDDTSITVGSGSVFRE